jgi:hypothetical protein
MFIGRIQRFFASRGFGFIDPFPGQDLPSEPLFFGRDQCVDGLEPSNCKAVAFELGLRKGRTVAVKVRPRKARRRHPVTVLRSLPVSTSAPHLLETD